MTTTPQRKRLTRTQLLEKTAVDVQYLRTQLQYHQNMVANLTEEVNVLQDIVYLVANLTEEVNVLQDIVYWLADEASKHE